VTVEPTGIAGLYVVEGVTHADTRGFFRETYRMSELAQVVGRELTWRQGSHARSRPGVVRGFHAEPWDKLVYVARGTVFAAVADVRPDSPTFARTETFLLGDPPGARRRLFVSEGLANAYCATGSDDVDYLYDVTAEWSPDAPKLAVAWDDPDLGVRWPVTRPVVSDADSRNAPLRTLFPDHPLWG
jgi:dTDP-4-dehydrorhamnose 3,5-epimerase